MSLFLLSRDSLLLCVCICVWEEGVEVFLLDLIGRVRLRPSFWPPGLGPFILFPLLF